MGGRLEPPLASSATCEICAKVARNFLVTSLLACQSPPSTMLTQLNFSVSASTNDKFQKLPGGRPDPHTWEGLGRS